jgi:hypothetical protein
MDRASSNDVLATQRRVCPSRLHHLKRVLRVSPFIHLSKRGLCIDPMQQAPSQATLQQLQRRSRISSGSACNSSSSSSNSCAHAAHKQQQSQNKFFVLHFVFHVAGQEPPRPTRSVRRMISHPENGEHAGHTAASTQPASEVSRAAPTPRRSSSLQSSLLLPSTHCSSDA